jgi:hypothetical protein
VDDAVVRNSPTQSCMGLNEARASKARRVPGGQSGGEAVLVPGADTRELEGLLK